MADEPGAIDFFAAGIKIGDIIDVPAMPGFVETTSGAAPAGIGSARQVRVLAVQNYSITFEPVDEHGRAIEEPVGRSG